MTFSWKKSVAWLTAAALTISGTAIALPEDTGETARNLAYRRAAYHSSAFDYDLTAHLATDGLFSSLDIWAVEAADRDGDNPAGEEPDKAFDSDPATKWLTRQPTGWLQVAFPGDEAFAAVSYTITSAADASGRDPMDWVVEGSADGKQFVELDRQTGQTFSSRKQQKTYTIAAPAAYRYYRLSVEQNHGEPLCQLAEWDLLGADGKTLLRHEQPQAGEFISLWRSKEAGDQWLYVDLGGESRFDTVKLYWNTAGFATGYDIQISDDARTWATVYTQNDGKGGVETLSFPTATARYVRLLCHETAAPTYALTELEVYGTNDVAYTIPAAPDRVENARQDLSGGQWALQRAPQVEQAGEALSTSDADDADWLPAVVPGTVLTSYVKAGAVPDARIADNQLQQSDAYFWEDFWYRRAFTVPADQAGQRVTLHFDAINWKADVYLNGAFLGDIQGAFIRGEFDVTDRVRFGEENHLAVLIHRNDTPGTVTEQTYDNVGPNGGKLGADAPTIHASVGWDWVPTIRGRCIGIYEDVYLTYSGNATLRDPWVITDLDVESGDFSKADLTVKTDLHNPTDRPMTVTVSGSINPGGLTFAGDPITIPARTRLENVTVATLTLDDPRLWWPNTYGEQFLYTCTLQLHDGGRMSDEKTFSFGVREFTYEIGDEYIASSSDPNKSNVYHPMTVYCNGTRIICRGGNWGMDDADLAAAPEDYDIKLRLHKEANFNMIRNWVGMTNHPAFYAACDKYGILVWDDFWLANPGDGLEPNDEAMFIRNARDKVSRNRVHPAVVLYCGRNEGYPPATLNTALAALTEELDSTRIYIPHSAADLVGGFGPYGVKDPQFYFNNTYKLLQSERGVPNIPAYESMMKMLTADHAWPIDDVWGLHDYCRYGAQGVEFYNQYLKNSYGVDVEDEALGLATFVRYAQMINYESHKAMFEALYANEGNGLLMWMSQSAWPSMVWQSYDYYYDTNAGYFAAKAANQPVNAIYNAATNRVVLSNATGQDLKKLTTTLAIYDLQGQLIEEKTSVNDIAASSVVELMHVPVYAGTTPVQFIKTTVRDESGRQLAEDFYWSNRLRPMEYRALDDLAAVTLTTEVTDAVADGDSRLYIVSVRNDSDTPALLIRLKTQNDRGEQVLPVYYEDNYFSLMPGESKTVTLEFADKYLNGGQTALSVEGFNIVPAAIDTPAPHAAAIKGDVDGDKTVSAADALLALQAATGKIALTAAQEAAADVDDAPGVSAADALMILQAATGKITL
ncbi:MAG: glycosyl hydrolase 2 galactose-binding domain-containing protein [Acutalibacteraceae bacterium]|jgi:beta-galactosidase/beta-glucuronidase